MSPPRISSTCSTAWASKRVSISTSSSKSASSPKRSSAVRCPARCTRRDPRCGADEKPETLGSLRRAHALEVHEVNLFGFGAHVVEEDADFAVRTEGEERIDAVSDRVGESLFRHELFEAVVQRLAVKLVAEVVVAIVGPHEERAIAVGQ